MTLLIVSKASIFTILIDITSVSSQTFNDRPNIWPGLLGIKGGQKNQVIVGVESKNELMEFFKKLNPQEIKSQALICTDGVQCQTDKIVLVENVRS